MMRLIFGSVALGVLTVGYIYDLFHNAAHGRELLPVIGMGIAMLLRR